MTAQTPAEMKLVTERAMHFTLMSGTEDGPSPADDYALKMFMARNMRPKIAAGLLDGAAQIALTAGAYDETLHALEEAQQRYPSKMRRQTIDMLKEKLAILAAQKHEVRVGPVAQEVRQVAVVAEVVGSHGR
jgi:hypothetical protein